MADQPPQPHEIILDHLRALRAGQDRIEHDIKELKAGQIAIRSDFHGLRGDFLRLERALATVEVDIDHINSGAVPGQHTWDGAIHKYKFCNGTNWIDMTGASGGGSQTYQCVFATSTSYNGSLGGVSGANAKCATQATAASLGGTYKAWIAITTGVDNPLTTFKHGTLPYKLTDGTTTVANNWTGLTNGSIAHEINEDETGATIPDNTYVWTNAAADGTAFVSGSSSTTNCSGWGASQSSRTGWAGNITSSYTASYWATDTTTPCNYTNRLYCFEQSLTCNNTVDAFTFTNAGAALLSTAVNSDIVPITGADSVASGCGVAISVSGAASAKYRVCSDATCSANPAFTATAGTAGGGQYVQAQVTTSASTYTATSATVTIGGVSATFTANTGNGLGYQRVFITSTNTYTGSLGGITGASGADSKCASAATGAGLSGTYKAWIAITAGADDPATTFTRSSVPYKLVDGTTTVANNWTGLTSGTLLHAITEDQTGATVSHGAWTNVNTNGTATGSGSSSAYNLRGYTLQGQRPLRKTVRAAAGAGFGGGVGAWLRTAFRRR